MKGVVTVFLSFRDYDDPSIPKMVECFREINKEFISNMENEQKYYVCIVPTCNESSRLEKMDFVQENQC